MNEEVVVMWAYYATPLTRLAGLLPMHLVGRPSPTDPSSIMAVAAEPLADAMTRSPPGMGADYWRVEYVVGPFETSVAADAFVAEWQKGTRKLTRARELLHARAADAAVCLYTVNARESDERAFLARASPDVLLPMYERLRDAELAKLAAPAFLDTAGAVHSL